MVSDACRGETSMWIKSSEEFKKTGRLPVFTKRFSVRGGVSRCLVKITATGIFDLVVNGDRIPDYFMPGWSDYSKYINLCEYDIADKLKEDNLIEITVADGWYSGKLGYGNRTCVYGDEKRVFVEITAEYADGTTDVYESDDDWTVRPSAVAFADFFDGERLDFSDCGELHNRQYKAVIDSYNVKLEKYGYEPVHVDETNVPAVIYSDGGVMRYDFSTNAAGVVSFVAKGKKGDKVVIRYAEVLDENGELYVANLRRAECRDEMILSGGEDTFDPKFTFHGFRYAEILTEGDTEIMHVRRKTLTQAIDYSGNFECSDAVMNGVFDMARRGQKSNFIGIPTDCPQRDERLGWTGDAEVFCNSAMFNADCEKFFANYLKLVRTDALPDGRIPSFAPFYVPVADNTAGVPGWADCITVIPYFHYLHYRDESIIKDNLAAAEKWISYYLSKSTDYIVKITNNFGDWLAPADTSDADVINQCFFGYSLKLISKCLRAVRDFEKQSEYERLYAESKAAFRRTYYRDGRIKGDTQTVYALAYAVGFVTAEEIKKPLSDAVKRNGNALATGFIGSRFLLPALCDAGESELAYEIITRTEYPSWGYMLKNGATTVWERWNGYTEDAGFEDPEMNSFNHYSLGSCTEWFYSYVLGIKLGDDGSVTIKPTFTDKLSYAKGRVKLKHGYLGVLWQNENAARKVTITADDGVVYKCDFGDLKTIKTEKTDKNTAVFTLA